MGVLEIIDQHGFYVFTPKDWPEKGKEVDQLIKEGVIESFADAGINYFNGEYHYIRKDNPKGIYIAVIDTPYGKQRRPICQI